MAHLQRSVASLRIAGEDLRPDELTALLGVAPSHAYSKGDVQTMSGGRTITKKFGFWGLSASEAEPENFDGQVTELLTKLPADLDLWHQLSIRFDVDLFCGWFMGSSNEGLEISPQTLRALGERGIKLGIDIYGPDREI